jgi:hypothetical protein
LVDTTGNTGAKNVVQASPPTTQAHDPAFTKYLKKLDKYGEKDEDECE